MSDASAIPEGRVSLLPRWAHFLYARSLGYFWVECPLCGTGFGGHEWRDVGGNVSEIPILGAICPRCTRGGRGHVAGRDRDGALVRVAQLVNVSGGGRGLFLASAGGGSVWVWLLNSRELAVLPESRVALARGAA